MSAPALIQAAKILRAAADDFQFQPPITHVYNPLDYAWPAHELYLRRYGGGCKRVVFLGMNPGPFGMMQTGVPFGEIAAVRDWLGIEAIVRRPQHEHPRRRIFGFACPRSEVSGRRLWGLFAVRFGSARHFFADHFVVNYCPLIFLEKSGRNRTPDKLAAQEKASLLAACDAHLRAVIKTLRPQWVIGVGDFAAKRAEQALPSNGLRIGRILHPSPANPRANRDWSGLATAQLRELGVWSQG